MALFGVKGEVERALTARTAAALQDAGLPWAIARFDGRDAILEGLSFSRAERDSALAIIKDLWGVRRVADKTNLIASPETYTWSATKDDQKIKIRGHVPTKDDRQAILGFVKASMPDMEVDDKMVLAGGSPQRQAWLGAVSFSLVQLGQLKSGSVSLAGTELTVNGEARTTAAYRLVKNALSNQLPAGMTLNADRVGPPVIEPFSWRAKYSGSTVSFSGHVPNEEMRMQILERAQRLFPGKKVEDAMELGSGAPNGLLWAISASLTQLHRLNSGRVKLKDTDLEFEGIAADKSTAEDVAASIRHSLPSTYRSSEKVTAPEKQETQKPPVN